MLSCLSKSRKRIRFKNLPKIKKKPVEKTEGGNLLDEVIGEDELGGGGGDLHGDLLEAPVGAVHSRLVAVATCTSI